MIEADFTVDREKASIHFSMRDAGLILLSGKNGAGKTSSLLCMAGVLNPGSGSFKVNGNEMFSIPAGKRKIVYINQNSYFSGMTVLDHMRMVSTSSGRIRDLSTMFSLDPEDRVDLMSQGNRMRVAVSTAILSSPRVMLLDEIISNISDPEAFLEPLRESMARFAFDVVFVSQNENMAGMSDHHYVITDGETAKAF